MKNKVNEFKKELKELLRKYEMSINVGYDDGSDTYGMSGEHMTCEDNKGNEYLICEDWYMEASDIKVD